MSKRLTPLELVMACRIALSIVRHPREWRDVRVAVESKALQLGMSEDWYARWEAALDVIDNKTIAGGKRMSTSGRES